MIDPPTILTGLKNQPLYLSLEIQHTPHTPTSINPLFIWLVAVYVAFSTYTRHTPTYTRKITTYTKTYTKWIKPHPTYTATAFIYMDFSVLV